MRNSFFRFLFNKKVISFFLFFGTVGIMYAGNQRNLEIVNSLKDYGFSKELIVFFTAMLPIVELRGAIPIGLLDFFQLNLPVWKVYLLAVLGNMIPIFFILFFFKWVEIFFSKFAFTKNIMDKLFERTRKKSKVIEKYKELGLIFFVAIPLPVTGGWTGSLAAYLFGLSYIKSIFCILTGVCLAGIMVTILSILGWWGALIACIILGLLLFQRFIRAFFKKEG